jgi:hypothetical protein
MTVDLCNATRSQVTNACVCSSTDTLRRFHLVMHTQHHGPPKNVQVAVDTIEDYDGLIDRLKRGEADLAKSGIMHICIDPVPGQPVMYIAIREFIEQLPRE